MSKKKIYNKHLERGRFYIHSDGHGGHPALLYKKSDKKNSYFVIVFTSSPGPKRIKLKHSIEPIKVRVSFVHNTPSKSKRRDLGSRPLEGIKINKEDKPKIAIGMIKYNATNDGNSIFSSSNKITICLMRDKNSDD